MKKTIFWVGFVGTVLFCISLFATQVGICKLSNFSCVQFFDPIAETVIVFVPLFILSLITYKMREVITQRWLKFTYIWVPLTMVLVILSPEYDSSLFPMSKDVVSLSMSVLFLVISLLIILISYLKSPKTQ